MNINSHFRSVNKHILLPAVPTNMNPTLSAPFHILTGLQIAEFHSPGQTNFLSVNPKCDLSFLLQHCDTVFLWVLQQLHIPQSPMTIIPTQWLSSSHSHSLSKSSLCTRLGMSLYNTCSLSFNLITASIGRRGADNRKCYVRSTCEHQDCKTCLS
jgi:hypothetical protein